MLNCRSLGEGENRDQADKKEDARSHEDIVKYSGGNTKPFKFPVASKNITHAKHTTDYEEGAGWRKPKSTLFPVAAPPAHEDAYGPMSLSLVEAVFPVMVVAASKLKVPRV